MEPIYTIADNEVTKNLIEDFEKNKFMDILDPDKEISLYTVETEYIEPLPSNKITKNVIRVLATSVNEAASIVQESCDGTDETVTAVFKSSHITGLTTNRYKIVKI